MFGHDDVCKDCSGPYEVSLDHLINIVAAARRNHPLAPSPPPVVPDEVRSLASLFAGKSPQPEGLLSVHCSFEPAALPTPPPHPSSPRRTGHRLLNFNDQSSERTLTSLLMKLPAVPLRIHPCWLRYVVSQGDFKSCVADEIEAWHLLARLTGATPAA